MVEAWAKSEHAGEGVDCLTCHAAQESDWDYTEHFTQAIAPYPTAGDCRVPQTRVRGVQPEQALGSGDDLLLSIVRPHRL